MVLQGLSGSLLWTKHFTWLNYRVEILNVGVRSEDWAYLQFE